MGKSSLFATVDRIESDADGRRLAVLVFDDEQQLTVLLERLPDGCREGSVLSLEFEIDQSETEGRRQAVRDIQSRLFGTDRDSMSE